MVERICFIKSVLNSLQLYYIYVFLMLKVVAWILTNIQRRFLSIGVSKQGKIYKVKWSSIIVREKDKDGLGICSLLGKNKSMLYKWIWRLSLIYRKLQMKGIITMNGLPFFDNNLLEIWRGIMSVIKQGEKISYAITNYVRFKVENGKTTSFYEKFLVEDRLLKLQFLCLYKLTSKEEGKVSDMGLWLIGIWTWKLYQRQELFIFQQEHAKHLHVIIEGLHLSHNKLDQKIQSLDKDNNYSLKLCSSFIDKNVFKGYRHFKSNEWFKMAPPKIQTFMWSTVQN